jgi:glucosamine--fructose-6-phosphate aminotransferase (isomerizing)
MCGIVGILGRGAVAELLVDSLKRLEYRGYDSAGVATLEGDRLERRRAQVKLRNLEVRLRAEPLSGNTGHTRWATHGKPTEHNAHPHATDRVAVAHLVTSYLKKGASPADAIKATLPRLRGAFALGFLFKGHHNLLIGARKGSPLAIGYGDGEMYLGSDAIALAPFTDTISYLEDGD